jgi:hypothetical protein
MMLRRSCPPLGHAGFKPSDQGGARRSHRFGGEDPHSTLELIQRVKVYLSPVMRSAVVLMRAFFPISVMPGVVAERGRIS